MSIIAQTEHELTSSDETSEMSSNNQSRYISINSVCGTEFVKEGDKDMRVLLLL